MELTAKAVPEFSLEVGDLVGIITSNDEPIRFLILFGDATGFILRGIDGRSHFGGYWSSIQKVENYLKDYKYTIYSQKEYGLDLVKK
jgi:hypothetical protein